MTSIFSLRGSAIRLKLLLEAGFELVVLFLTLPEYEDHIYQKPCRFFIHHVEGKDTVEAIDELLWRKQSSFRLSH